MGPAGGHADFPPTVELLSRGFEGLLHACTRIKGAYKNKGNQSNPKSLSYTVSGLPNMFTANILRKTSYFCYVRINTYIYLVR